MDTISPGTRGHGVRDVQSRLLALGFLIDAPELAEHRYGASTEQAVRAFQQERGLLVDGLVGPQTWQEMVEAGYALADRVLYLRQPPFRGDDVRALQRRLNTLGFDPGREDGIFGGQTAQAVRDFQTNVGLRADGIVGATTVDALDRLFRAPGKGPGRTAVRETESMRTPGGALPGRRIAIDPGHGPDDPGAVGPGGLTEAEAAYSLAERLAEELRARGAHPLLLRSPGETPDQSDRATRANEAGAEMVVSVHLNNHEDPAAEGSSAYYFGRLGSVSVAGQALAELFQEEVVAATGLRNGRTHPMSFPILRETQMPAVHVEPCFITNPKEEQLLREGPFLRETALAMARALDRFFAGRAAETPEPGRP
ncbi:MAG: N-acetylmuramoyl-L-alanine amidase [Actinomycetota bacterium]